MKRFLITLLAILFLMSYTSYKLYKMYEIEHAFKTSAQTCKLTYKWIQETGKYTFYMITWAKDIDNIGQYEEDNLEFEDWDRLKPGDELEVVKMHNDAFSRQSVYIETGNFGFDFGLLGLELFGLIMLIWKRKRFYSAMDKIIKV